MYYEKKSEERNDSMTISLRLSEEESQLFKTYANMHGISISEMVRRSVLERIEDEYDLKAYEEAIAEYQKNPVTYSHEEVANLLDLD